jgi:hypothetical protein
MEPLDDHELKELVPAWKAPETPEHLHRQIFGTPAAIVVGVALTGGIRVPVPACAAIVLLVAWLALGRRVDALPVLPTAARRRDACRFPAPAEVQVKLVGALP